MKNTINTILLVLFFIPAYSQNTTPFEYTGNETRAVKKEKLENVQSLSDISPDLWQKLGLPFKEREELERRRKVSYSLGYYVYPEGGYTTAIDYVSVEISATNNGKVSVAKSTNDQLSAKQKALLSAAGTGTDLSIRIKFSYKSQGNYDRENKIVEGALMLRVVPETQAEYPGGNKQVTDYLRKNVFDKAAAIKAAGRVDDAAVRFTVNEEGRVTDARIDRTSGSIQTDKLILDAISAMPKWKPAKNSKGVKVKQEFYIPFWGDGC